MFLLFSYLPTPLVDECLAIRNKVFLVVITPSSIRHEASIYSINKLIYGILPSPSLLGKNEVCTPIFPYYLFFQLLRKHHEDIFLYRPKCIRIYSNTLVILNFQERGS